MKECSSCKRSLTLDSFYPHKGGKFSVRGECKECYNKKVKERSNTENYKEKARNRSRLFAKKYPERVHKSTKIWRLSNLAYDAERQRIRKASVNLACPIWADKNKIEMVYKKAQQYGLSVDHIVPLKSKLVCGLHVWENLQLLDSKLNSSKRNLHWPEMP